MKGGFPFSRALAAWNLQKMRGPLLALVFLLLGAVVGSPGEVCRNQSASYARLSAETYLLLSQHSEYFLPKSCKTPTHVSRSADKHVRLPGAEANSFPRLDLAHEEV
jgi:hypothetical protein